MVKKTLSESQCIYVIENSNHLVKIGVSKNLKQRIRALETGGGYKIINVFHTEKCSNSSELESKCHRYFKKYNTFGEWFAIPFETAKAYVKSLKLEFDFLTEKEQNASREEMRKFAEAIVFSGQLTQVVAPKFCGGAGVYRVDREQINRYRKEILKELDSVIDVLIEDGGEELAEEYLEYRANYNKTESIDVLVDFIADYVYYMPKEAIEEMCEHEKFYGYILNDITSEINDKTSEIFTELIESKGIISISRDYIKICHDIEETIGEYYKNDKDVLFPLFWHIGQEYKHTI